MCKLPALLLNLFLKQLLLSYTPKPHYTEKPSESLGSNIHIMHPKYWGFRRQKKMKVAKHIARDIFFAFDKYNLICMTK